MLFNSFDFAVFIPLTFTLYWMFFNKNIQMRNAFILIASYLFYGWWDARFLLLIAFSSIMDFLIGQYIFDSKSQRKKQWLLYSSLLVNLGLLCFFKYFNFFAESFTNAFTFFGSTIETTHINIILPVGISFYTFQTLSYTIDIYRGNLKPTKDLLAFSAFVSFFPQLVAGPIERASRLLPQFHKKTTFNSVKANEAIIDIAWGFFKKIVIADGLSIYVNTVYNNVDSYEGFPIIWATLFFAFQIYCDFSGYSSIAIGLAKLFGFELMQNFKRPYLSKTLPEFWSRWHISLSTWFKDYVYIPLGGNQVSKIKQKRNLLATFIISGFWHGANWTFIIWGGIHGIMNLISKRMIKIEGINVFNRLFTMVIVCLAWVFFRANNFFDAIYVLGSIIPFSTSNIIGVSTIPKLSFIFSILSILTLLVIEVIIEKTGDSNYPKSLNTIIISIVLISLIYIFGTFENQEFIYFQF